MASITTSSAHKLGAFIGLALLHSAASGETLIPSLWIADDAQRVIYRVGTDGQNLASFVPQITTTVSYSIAPSGISAGADNTVWVVTEQPGRLLQYSATGEKIGPIISTDRFGARGPEGVAFDASDQSLWLVDDPDLDSDPDFATKVYHVDLTGTLLGQFPTKGYDNESISPQAIAVDPTTQTLWITDNHADKVYNVSRSGELLGWFGRTAFDPAATNLQGVSAGESGQTLWVSDRSTGKIYHLSIDGRLLAEFPGSRYDPGSQNPVGIAFSAATTLYRDSFE